MKLPVNVNDPIMIERTMVIRVDEKEFSKKNIENLLYKWGCEVSDYYYRKVYAIND